MADVCRRKAIGVKFVGGKTDGSVEESIWPTFVGGKTDGSVEESNMADVCRRNPMGVCSCYIKQAVSQGENSFRVGS